MNRPLVFISTYTYDKLGRVLTITDAGGGVTSTEYDGNGNVTKATDAEGNVITYTYDALNRLSGYTDAAGYTFAFTYDANGNKTSETDGNGNITYYTYDALDRLVGRTDAEGGISAKTYDADGRLIKVVNEEGAETTYRYDDCNRVIEMVDALGNSTTYTYDELDRVLTVTDPRGGVTTYTYTDRGDIATETDAEGYVTSYEYDGNRNMIKKTTPDGVTTHAYDPLDRLIATVTPDGKSESFEYDGLGRIISSTDKGSHKTKYIYDAKGNVVETIDALGNSTLFEYDALGNLTKLTQHRVDTQDKVDEWEITLYEYDGRSLNTKVIDALGNVTRYEYDGNGNLVKQSDADGYVTVYSYNALDLVTNINYNGGKQVSYQYNAVGELVEMTDWTGTNTFELDLLNRITKATDHKGRVTEYGYDMVGNQTSILYPDNTTVAKTYDLVSNLKSVTETDGRKTTYEYDGMGRVTHMAYPHGWKEDYTYDAIGQLLAVTDTDPTQKDMKQQKHTYEYDDCGNMVYEYMRGNGTGQATTEVFYTYDALHRVVKARETYGSATRNYQYDSLGNLTYESNSNNVKTDYKYNNLNQITETSDDGWKNRTTYTYDKRGNLRSEVFSKKNTVVGSYVYDETNRMVKGTNELGEQSIYSFNGLDVLVEQTWIIKKNAYGYTNVASDAVVDGEAVVDAATGSKQKKAQLDAEVVQSNATPNKTSTIVKQFVIDYTSENHAPLMEYEVGGLTYRYVYGNHRLSVDILGITNGAGNLVENGNHVRLYYHTDYLGTTDYLTSPVSKKVTSWTHYNEWGEITHNAVLKMGVRELDLVKNYTGHEYDAVLGQFYAKYRMYDAADRRFTTIDPIRDGLNWYSYVENNPIMWVDPLGLFFIFKYTDANTGATTYFVTDQSHPDAWVSAGLPTNVQPFFTEMSTVFSIRAKLVGGSSVSVPSAWDVFEEIHAAEIDAITSAIADFGNSIYPGAGSIAELLLDWVPDIIGLFDIPKNVSIAERDDLLMEVLSYNSISTVSTSEHFPAALYALDDLIAENPGYFGARVEKGCSEYEWGRALSEAGTNISSVTAGIKNSLKMSYFDYFLAQAANEQNDAYSIQQYYNNLKNGIPIPIIAYKIPSDYFDSMTCEEFAQKHLGLTSFPVTTYDIAKVRFDQFAEDYITYLTDAYDAATSVINSLFYENVSTSIPAAPMEPAEPAKPVKPAGPVVPVKPGGPGNRFLPTQSEQ